MSVFIGYHSPCLDGAYSALVSFFFFREIQKNGISTQDFIEYICQYNDYQSIDRTIIEYKSIKQGIDSSPATIEETKHDPTSKSLDPYSPALIKDVTFVPLKLNSEGILEFPYTRYPKQYLKGSVFLLLDFSVTDLNQFQKMETSFLKIVIVDHHLTFEHLLSHFQSKGSKGLPKNIIQLYRKENSGAMLALEFFEKLKGEPLLPNKEQHLKLLEITKYIEDNDIKANKVPNSEEFVSGFLSKRVQLIPHKNPGMFKHMFELDVQGLIEIGSKELQYRKERAKTLIKNGKRIIYLGGKTRDQKGKYGICYGLETYELDLRSEIGHQLALESIKDGLTNMGVVYRVDKYNDNIYNLSLRSVKGVPDGDCESLSRLYKGGGHYNAAGCSITKAHMRSWL